MQDGSFRSRATFAHASALVTGAGALLSAIAFGEVILVAVAGGSIILSGVAAFVGRKSVLVPRVARERLEHVTDPEERRQVTEASGMLTGLLLTFFGLALLAFGLLLLR